MIAQREGRTIPISLPIEYIEYKLCDGRFTEYKALHGIPEWKGVPSRTVLQWIDYMKVDYNVNKPKETPKGKGVNSTPRTRHRGSVRTT